MSSAAIGRCDRRQPHDGTGCGPARSAGLDSERRGHCARGRVSSDMARRGPNGGIATRPLLLSSHVTRSNGSTRGKRAVQFARGVRPEIEHCAFGREQRPIAHGHRWPRARIASRMAPRSPSMRKRSTRRLRPRSASKPLDFFVTAIGSRAPASTRDRKQADAQAGTAPHDCPHRTTADRPDRSVPPPSTWLSGVPSARRRAGQQRHIDRQAIVPGPAVTTGRSCRNRLRGASVRGSVATRAPKATRRERCRRTVGQRHDPSFGFAGSTNFCSANATSASEIARPTNEPTR